MWLVVFIIFGLVIYFLINTSTPSTKSTQSSGAKLKTSDIKWEKLPDDFVVFDFETTGLKTNKTPVDIIEIAAIKVKKSDLQKGLGVETFSALVKPWRGGLNPEAMAINKITQKRIDSDGEDMSKVIHEFIELRFG